MDDAVMLLDSKPYPARYLPFTNETELQEFLENHAEKILGLTMIASSRSGRRRLFDIDLLAIDAANTAFIVECKWDLVDAGTLRQLAMYRDALLAGWSEFQARVSESRRERLQLEVREPVLIAIGYRCDPSILSSTESVCLTYRYHDVDLGNHRIERRHSGAVSIHPANTLPSPASRHPIVSKKHYTFERLAPLPQPLQEAFWAVDATLLELNGVTAFYGGKNYVRYRIRELSFVEARISPRSIRWSIKQPGTAEQQPTRTLEMCDAGQVNDVIGVLRKAYGESCWHAEAARGSAGNPLD